MQAHAAEAAGGAGVGFRLMPAHATKAAGGARDGVRLC